MVSAQVYDYDAITSKIQKHVYGEDPEAEARFPLQFVRGYFNESLHELLAVEREMRPAIYVDVDVDQYLPTAQALRWLFRSGLVVPGLTVIGYDDFGSTELWVAGESRAHEEIAAEFGVRFELLFSECMQGGVIPERGCALRVGATFHAVFRVLECARCPEKPGRVQKR